MDELEIEDYYLGKIVGGIKAWCEAAMSDAKEMSFSTPFSSKYVDFLQPKMEELSEKCNVKSWFCLHFMTPPLGYHFLMNIRSIKIAFVSSNITKKSFLLSFLFVF